LPEDTRETGDRGVSTGKNTGNVIGGYKATLKSEMMYFPTFQSSNIIFLDPRVSDEAKHHAEEVLRENEAI